jgi:hypothetical protein
MGAVYVDYVWVQPMGAVCGLSPYICMDVTSIHSYTMFIHSRSPYPLSLPPHLHTLPPPTIPAHSPSSHHTHSPSSHQPRGRADKIFMEQVLVLCAVVLVLCAVLNYALYCTVPFYTIHFLHRFTPYTSCTFHTLLTPFPYHCSASFTSSSAIFEGVY